MTAALLFEIAWKTGLVAALVLAGAALLRFRPAAERVGLLRLGVLLVFALPLLSVAVPALRVETPSALTRLEPAQALVAAPVAAPSAAPVAAAADRPAVAAPPAPPPGPSFNPLLAVAALYGAGVALLLLRLLGAVWTLARWTRAALPVTDARWLAALERAVAGGSRPRLLVSPRVASPLSWGVRPGVVLIGEDALAQADRADAVLTHELGHIRHGDWLFLMLSRLLVALFWFNPLVWLLQRELARQSEQAADAWAVRRIARVDYASALVAMARGARPHAALGMAAPSSELARRISAVLAGPTRKGRPWPTAMAAVACVGFAAPLAALELAPEAAHPVLRLAAAPSPAGPRTAAAVVALLPEAFAKAQPRPLGVVQSPDERGVVLRQRDQGLALMDAGVRQMENAARQMRRQAAEQPMEPADREQLLREADQLDAEAEQLRQEARDLAAQDPSTLRPMTAEDERELAEDMAKIQAIPMPMELSVNVRTDLGADVRLAPSPETLSADLRSSAQQMRGDAASLDADADRMARTPPLAPRPPGPPEPPGLRDAQVGAMRAQANALRSQADSLEHQAASLAPPGRPR